MKHDPIILLIEDNPDDVELTRRAFARSNITNRLIVAKDGAEALDYLFARGAWAGRGEEDDPTMVLLDLKLPKVDGLEVLRLMRANPRTRPIPVIVLTCSSEEQDVVRSYDLGCNSYIRKPVDYVKFNEAALQLSRYWLVLNEPPLRSGGK